MMIMLKRKSKGSIQYPCHVLDEVAISRHESDLGMIYMKVMGISISFFLFDNHGSFLNLDIFLSFILFS